MIVVTAGLVVGQAVRIHVVHHFLGHQGTVFGVLFRRPVGIGLGLRACGDTGVGIGLGLPGLVEKLGNELLFVLHLGDGVHLVHGLGLGGGGQFQLQLGEHQLQARGGAQLAKGRGCRDIVKIDLAHMDSLLYTLLKKMKK